MAEEMETMLDEMNGEEDEQDYENDEEFENEEETENRETPNEENENCVEKPEEADELAREGDELILKADSDIESEHDEDGKSQDKSEEMEGEDSEKTQSRRDTEFTSENFKIEIRGLPRYYAMGQLKRLLNETLQLRVHKIKPAGPNKDWAYATFREEKARDRALAVLDEYKWRNSTLTSSLAKAVEDPVLKQSQEPEVPTEVVDPDDKTPINERIVKSVTPLAHLEYSEQLEKKYKSALNTMKKLGNEMTKNNPEVQKWVRFHKIRRKGQICEVGEMVPSPVTDGYRNKCEFTVGINPETELPTVGFRVSSYKAGSVAVGPVDHLVHISDTMKKVAEVFQEYVQNSEHKPFCPLTHEGVWRQLTVRTTLNDDILIAVVIHPQEFTDEQLGDIKQGIVDYFKDGSGSTVGVTSIHFQAIGQKEAGAEEPPFEHLWGEEYINETVLGKTFRISCESFFQVNTKACESLYETIAELAELDGTSVILDVCCGTGTIGISLADQCVKIFGLEMVEKAAQDARHNANVNGLENVAIYTGKAETNMNAVLAQCVKYNTIGVVDPPRAGVAESVIKAIRKCDNMNRLIYLSCDPDGAFKNFIDLTRPKSKQYKGEFFVPVKAAVVDMFPHTHHFELLVVFERWEELKWRRIMEGNPLPRDAEYFKRIPPKPEGAVDLDSDSEEYQQNTGMGGWQTASNAKRGRNREEKYQPYYNPRKQYPNERNMYEMGMYDRRYEDPDMSMRRPPPPGMMGGYPYDDRFYGGAPVPPVPYDRFYNPPLERPPYDSPYDRPTYERRDPYERYPADPYRLSYGDYDRYRHGPTPLSDRLSYRRDGREFMRY